jgi:hypothetical protein
MNGARVNGAPTPDQRLVVVRRDATCGVDISTLLYVVVIFYILRYFVCPAELFSFSGTSPLDLISPIFYDQSQLGCACRPRRRKLRASCEFRKERWFLGMVPAAIMKSGSVGQPDGAIDPTMWTIPDKFRAGRGRGEGKAEGLLSLTPGARNVTG